MSALEIVAIVVLCILGMCTIYIWGQVVILIDRVRIQQEAQKKSAPKDDEDKK